MAVSLRTRQVSSRVKSLVPGGEATIDMRLNPKPAAATAAIAFFLLLLLDLTWPGHGVWLLVIGIPLALGSGLLWWRDRLSAERHSDMVGQDVPFSNAGAYGLVGVGGERSRQSSNGVHASLVIAPVAALAMLLFVGGAIGSSEPTATETATNLEQDVTAIDRSRDGEPDTPQVAPQRPLQTTETATSNTVSSVSPPANTQQTGTTGSAQANTIVKPIVVAAPTPASSAVEEAEDESVALPQSTNTFEYTVAEGDTLYDIAERYGSTVDALMEINQLDSFSFIHPGDVLLIPREEDGEES